MDDFEQATNEYIAAIAESKEVHAQTFNQTDQESNDRYLNSYKRVEDAGVRWRELFKPGLSHG